MSTVTGNAATDRTVSLVTVIGKYFPPRTLTTGGSGTIAWTSEADENYNGSKSDDELIVIGENLKKSAKQAFNGKASFNDLWHDNETVLHDTYGVLNDTDPYDRSSADAGLAWWLLYLTGNNCDRALQLMWRSELKRDKWTSNKNYLPRTMLNMLAKRRQDNSPVYGQSVQVVKTTAPVDSVEFRTGHQFLAATQQAEYFAGCVYVLILNKIYTPDGLLLNREQFNATYGGYIFELDSCASGKTTRRAWEAFTESQAVSYPWAHGVCFKPECDPGQIVKTESSMLVNTYVPVDTPRKEGDATPFLTHIAKLLPDERDRTILISYMAACIQYKGIKFQWAPLIQGTEGNGKTLFTRCVAFAIGKKYTHWPKAADLDNKFNGWLLYALFIAVEDIYVSSHRREVIEAIKPMITGGDGLEIQLKGVDQVSADICCNFMFNSNHKDAIETNQNQRRFAIFHTAQQTVDDIKRDGMDGDYFPNLYDWLKADGYAIVANYLETYQIPDELNPATKCHRAPVTSSTESAIQSSMGDAEILITDAIDNDLLGFRGGIVWTKSAIELLRDNGKNIHTRALSRVLENIGYIKHPAADGSGRIKINGRRERFYVRRGHALSLIKNTNDLRDALHDVHGDESRGSRGRVGAASNVFSAPPQTQ